MRWFRKRKIPDITVWELYHGKSRKTIRSTYMLWSSVDCGQTESIRYLNMNSSRWLYVTELIVWVTENKTGVSRTNDWCDITIMESFITLCWIHLSIRITTCQQQWIVTSQWSVDADFWKWEGVRKDKSRGTRIIGGGGNKRYRRNAVEYEMCVLF